MSKIINNIILPLLLLTLVSACESNKSLINDELHIVSLYEGMNSNSKIRKGKAKILVNRNSNNMILVISGYEQIEWEVEVNNSSQINKILAFGYHSQTVKCNHPIEIVTLNYDEDRLALYYGHQDEANNNRFINIISKLTGRTVTSITNNYRIENGSPLELN